MPRDKIKPVEQPPLLRLLLVLGRPFGLTFVPEHYMRVIDRMGRYATAKGPGLVYHSPLTETLGPLVYIAAQVAEFEFDNLLSRDVVPVKMQVTANVEYNPLGGPELASILTRLPREAYLGIARTFIRWGLLEAANQYTATELTQHPVRAAIEASARDRANEELAFLGLHLAGKLLITRVELPATLAERHETIAQRRASILAGTDFHPSEYRRALVSELIEQLARTGGSESFLNFGEMLESYEARRRPADAPRIVEEKPLLLEDKGQPPAAPPPGPDTAAPEAPPEPRPAERRDPRRNRSRL
jgi:hypothetical protein